MTAKLAITIMNILALIIFVGIALTESPLLAFIFAAVFYLEYTLPFIKYAATFAWLTVSIVAIRLTDIIARALEFVFKPIVRFVWALALVWLAAEYINHDAERRAEIRAGIAKFIGNLETLASGLVTADYAMYDDDPDDPSTPPVVTTSEYATVREFGRRLAYDGSMRPSIRPNRWVQ